MSSQSFTTMTEKILIMAYEKKVGYAKQLLEITDKNINELSFEAGFESPSHFIRSSKEHYRITPLRHKKQVQKHEQCLLNRREIHK